MLSWRGTPQVAQQRADAVPAAIAFSSRSTAAKNSDPFIASLQTPVPTGTESYEKVPYLVTKTGNFMIFYAWGCIPIHGYVWAAKNFQRSQGRGRFRKLS